MSYERQTFENGKTVLTADHLKHIEDGIIEVEKQVLNSLSYWNGKKFVVNGDSVAYGSTLSSVTDAYPYLIAKKLGMNVTNYAIGGSTVAKRTGDYDECYFNTQKWNEAKASGKLDTTKKYLVNTGENAPRIYQIFTYNGSEWVGGGTSSTVAGRTPLCDRIGAMDTDADVVLVHMSSNDWYYSWCPLGNFEDSTFRTLGFTGIQSNDNGLSSYDVSTGKSSNAPCETYYDGLHKLCKTLLNTYKNKDIFICTPMKRRQYGTWNSVYPEDTNADGKTVKDYCEAVEKVCEYYSIPCINLYKLSGLNCHIDSNMFASDFSHPNVEGHKKLASVISAQMVAMRM